jgi:hypothetical protein
MKLDKRPGSHIINKMIWINETAFNSINERGWATLATEEDLGKGLENIFMGKVKICEHPVTKELWKITPFKKDTK